MPSSKIDPPASWRVRIASVGNVGHLFSMLWAASPPLLVGTIFLRLARATLPAILLWIPKQILDGIINVSRGHGGLSRVWHFVALELMVALISDLLSQANNLLDSLLGERFTCHVATHLIEHAATLDLTSFEDPVFYDKLERVRGQATGRMFLLTSVMNAAQEASTLVALSAALTAFSPWLMGLLVTSTVPAFFGEIRFSKLSYSAFFRRTPERRELEYLRLLASWSESAKEVRIFDLVSHLAEKYQSLSQRIYAENKTLAERRALGGWLLGVLSALGYYAGYVVVLRAVLAGAISIGFFTFLTGSFARSRMSMARIFSELSGVSEQATLLNDLFDFFDMKPSIKSLPNAIPAPRVVVHGFEFRNVSFAYPGSDRLVVRNLNLHIAASEKLGVIGDNGAGKTTLVKLLSRLYDPVCGRILLDGIDLREYDLPQLRKRISVIFQDFVRYDLPVRDNIGFGDLKSRGNDQLLRIAAQKGGVHNLIDGFPFSYDQILGRRFKNGTELSGGEWQKIALARAFARDAQLVILDEPTANFDAQAEDLFFRRFSSLMEGRMAILISHRLSTLRLADRIVVLNGGEIQEQGTHEDLMKVGGRYRNLYNLQSNWFKADS